MLAGLVRDFDERTGLSDRASSKAANPPHLPDFRGQTIFRAVQEGLTNVAETRPRSVKPHSGEIDMRAKRRGPLCSATTGRRRKAPRRGQAGYGLTGLRERVEQLGGTFRGGPEQEGGFGIELRIPLREDVHD